MVEVEHTLTPHGHHERHPKANPERTVTHEKETSSNLLGIGFAYVEFNLLRAGVAAPVGHETWSPATKVSDGEVPGVGRNISVEQGVFRIAEALLEAAETVAWIGYLEWQT